MIRIVLASVLVLGFAGQTLAGDALSQDSTARPVPRLKELVSVTSDIVRIGDLVDNAGAAANIAVFRAPDLGQTGAVGVRNVADALRPHNVGAIDTHGLTEVVVTRLSRVITAKDIEERITRTLSGQYGFGDARNLGVTFDRDVRAMYIEASATSDLVVARMNVDPRTGRFDAAFEVPGSLAARRLPLRFSGIISETVEAATLIRALGRGDTVQASDVVVERRPKAEVAGDAINPDQAIGLSAKRALRAGSVLRPSDLAKTEIVQRNETVTIVYEVPGIMLTIRGKALEPGGNGDLINVLNVQSNRTVQATVIGPGRVSIAAIPPPIAAAVAPLAQNDARSRAE
jgi:flagella basal body P-ring formation protein FlgA